MSRAVPETLPAAVEHFRSGGPVLIHDAADREGETDLMYPATAVTPRAIARMRNEAGGLICVALPDEVADAFDLPFLHAALDHSAAAGHDVAYDERASFSISVNHRETRTGITDRDRARTIGALGEAAAAPGETVFAETFRAPGHVHLLRAAPGLLAEREGHTELGLALARAASVPPAVALCEMLDDETGEALSPTDAQAYARRHEYPYLEATALHALEF